MNEKHSHKIKNELKLMSMILIVSAATLSGCIRTGELVESESLDDGELVILTYDVYALTDGMINTFENESGLSVRMIKVDDAGSILDYLIQNKGNSNVDLAIGLDNTYLPTAIQFDLLTNVDVDKSMLSDGSTNGGMDPLTPYNGPLATPFDMGYICLNYDTSAVDGENLSLPTDLWDLTEPEWKGKVAFPSPVSSSPGRGFMLATLDYFNWSQDMAEFKSWWSSMVQNDLILTSGWTESYETHYSGGYGVWNEGHIGDAHITVSYCHSPGVEAFYGENWTNSASLNLAKTSFFQVEYAAAIDGGNFDYAQQFIEYLLSPDVNSKMPTENLMYSVLAGEDLPDTFSYRHHSLIPDAPSSISGDEIRDNMDTWLEEWNKAVTSGE